jgi:inorganic triphosphatase YgiF
MTAGKPVDLDDDEPREVEGALILLAEDPAGVARRLAELTAIGDYALFPRPAQSIRDCYFDTLDGALRDRGFALRIREVDGKPWITLKGGSRDEGDWASARLEIESPWSPAALRRVLSELDRRGIVAPKSELVEGTDGLPASSPELDPLETMQWLGLQMVQKRETRREVRDVVPRGTSERIAELDIDDVRYRFGDREAHLNEIEIEAKQEGVEDALRLVLDRLDEEWPELHRWRFSKLATGMAIERALHAGSEDVLTADGRLNPQAIGHIEALLDHM